MASAGGRGDAYNDSQFLAAFTLLNTRLDTFSVDMNNILLEGLKYYLEKDYVKATLYIDELLTYLEKDYVKSTTHINAFDMGSSPR